MMNLNLTSTLILIGLFQSATMIFLIFRNRNWKLIQNKLLISLLLVIGLSLLPTFFGKSGLIFDYSYLQFIPLRLVIFVFPILYLYLKSLFNFTFRFNRKNSLHLIIPMSFWLYYIFIWIGTLSIPVEGKGNWILGMGYFQVNFAHNIVLLFMACSYSFLSFQELREKKILNSKQKQVQWIKYLLIFLFVGVMFELISALLGKIYGYWKSSPLDIWLGFSLTMFVKIYNAILLYIISLMGYLAYSTFKKNRKVVDKDFIERKLQNILRTMRTEKPYLNSDFSLATFARQLETNPSTLSNLLNNHLNTTFNDFTNKYRIEEVKDRLKTGALHNLTLESIAKDSGFKSKTTFYRAFYKFNTQTPKEYIAQLENEKKVS
ncbi:helix-turn-helix domain-containing protein [Aquimarina spongiae]|uniref:AraC-type DNA-binding protein n=1 Tax=Aquimarina spongiae TaxID=570521 RepID=A0A1M6HDK6_9FLAO|nr:helix-turn-helix domain-containing protein [Aquimarina spongiae]SHJ20328.1 AraC-type DNA-binding protein [Aquimarina spongiae]